MKAKTDIDYTDCIDKELVEFATGLSKNFEKLISEQTYYSESKKYKVEVFDTINVYETELKTPARVGQTSGTIQVQKKQLQNYSKDFIFFLIIWCHIEHKLLNLEKSDKIAIKYYLITGKSKKNLYDGYIKMLESNHTDKNLDRFNKIKSLIKTSV
jgi:hypothetical protein